MTWNICGAMPREKTTMPPIKQELTKALAAALKEALGLGEAPADMESTFETPREERFGDISTNVVLRLAKELKKSPRELADKTCAALDSFLERSGLKGRISKVAVEGPGFINFYYSAEEIARVLLKIKEEGESFGKPKNLKAKNVLLEFVSANPTGPLTVAHGRQAALGDSLARILRFRGHRVTTEYYNNDEGVQIDTLGKSTHLRCREILTGKKLEIPENFYRGDYLTGLAQRLLDEKGEAFKKCGEEEQMRLCADFAKDNILQGIKKDLKDFGVAFDGYFSQAALMKSGKVEKALETLKQKGFVYEKDGAVWFESTRLGDDKDRVLVKSDGSYTYLMPDIAYHENKFSRGFESLIDILGPDHHGYIPRIKASAEALGFSRNALDILIAQLVTLYEGEKQVRMSTRAGEFVTLREIMDEVGKDAGRFFFVMRKFDAHLDFDLALAKSQTPDNPVFYIQYAHARVESIKGVNRERGGGMPSPEKAKLSLLTNPYEVRVMRLLAQYEDVIAAAERTLEPYRLVPYLMDLAADFHRFYTENRVITEDAPLTDARLLLIDCVQAVLRSGLNLLGVSAPVKM